MKATLIGLGLAIVGYALILALAFVGSGGHLDGDEPLWALGAAAVIGCRSAYWYSRDGGFDWRRQLWFRKRGT